MPKVPVRDGPDGLLRFMRVNDRPGSVVHVVADPAHVKHPIPWGDVALCGRRRYDPHGRTGSFADEDLCIRCLDLLSGPDRLLVFDQRPDDSPDPD